MVCLLINGVFRKGGPSAFWAFFGPLIKAGENSTWGNLLNTAQGFCSSGLGAK
jgi:hypothetical protein